jgi:hypothetical protein
VAIALLAGKLTPGLLDGPWLEQNADAVRAVASRTRVRASGAQTAAMLEGLGQAVPLLGLARAVGARRAWRARHQIRAAYLSAARRGGGRARKRQTPSPDSLGLLGALMRAARSARAPFDMANVDFSRLEFRFSADVNIRLRDGRTLEGQQLVPRGAAGHGIDATHELMLGKLRAETAEARTPGSARAIEAVLAKPARDTKARALAKAVVALGRAD